MDTKIASYVLLTRREKETTVHVKKFDFNSRKMAQCMMICSRNSFIARFLEAEAEGTRSTEGLFSQLQLLRRLFLNPLPKNC